MDDKMTDLYSSPGVIGVIGDPNTGKSNLLYWTIHELRAKNKFQLFYYGLRAKVDGAQQIYTVTELENIRNSVVILDEFATMFELEDRKEKRSVEQSLRLIFHNNNVIVLCGLPENFKKFVASKLTACIFKTCSIGDAINGSRVKKIITNYRGPELGASTLNLPKEFALLFDGEHYSFLGIPYMPEYDTKAHNLPILMKSVPIHVPNNVQQNVPAGV